MPLTRLALLLGLLVMAGCGEGTADGGTGDAPRTLDGRTFVGDAVTGRALVKGTQIRLSFADGQVGAHAGCNHLGGRASVQDGVLVVDALGGTEMGCAERRMAQDSWLAAFLTSRPDVVVGKNQLALTRAGVTVTLTDEARIQATNPIELEGTTWRLESLVHGDTAASVPGSRRPSLRLDGGNARVFTGCTTVRGSVDIGPSTLRIDTPQDPGSCTHGDAALHDSVLAVLRDEVTYEQAHDTLTLTTKDDGTGLVFMAAG